MALLSKFELPSPMPTQLTPTSFYPRYEPAGQSRVDQSENRKQQVIFEGHKLSPPLDGLVESLFHFKGSDPIHSVRLFQ